MIFMSPESAKAPNATSVVVPITSPEGVGVKLIWGA